MERRGPPEFRQRGRGSAAQERTIEGSSRILAERTHRDIVRVRCPVNAAEQTGSNLHGEDGSKAKARRQESKKSNLPTLDPPPALLEGEDEAAYEKLLAQVTAAVEPKDIIEEFWVRDVVDLAWEALRLRRLKADLLNRRLPPGSTRSLTIWSL